jgi:inosine/xanthosine triphosphate pyrophosphatase family protein
MLPAIYTLQRMKQLTYVTANPIKFDLGDIVCKQNGITLVQKKLDIEEIQSLDGEYVARHKAAQAYELLQQPVIITDDSWDIPGLNGFPGTYMQAINTWFTPEDWLRLTLTLQDRRIILRQILVYQDAKQQKLITIDVEGKMLDHVSGTSEYPSLTITSFDGTDTSSAVRKGEKGSYTGDRHTVWHDFVVWLDKQALARKT